MIVNLTRHSIEIHDARREHVVSLPPSGEVARVTMTREYQGDVDGIPLYAIVPSDVTGLPEQRDDVLLVVSDIVQYALPEREDLWRPGELIRDSAGGFTGCVGLSR